MANRGLALELTGSEIRTTSLESLAARIRDFSPDVGVREIEIVLMMVQVVALEDAYGIVEKVQLTSKKSEAILALAGRRIKALSIKLLQEAEDRAWEGQEKVEDFAAPPLSKYEIESLKGWGVLK